MNLKGPYPGTIVPYIQKKSQKQGNHFDVIPAAKPALVMESRIQSRKGTTISITDSNSLFRPKQPPGIYFGTFILWRYENEILGYRSIEHFALLRR